MREKRALLVATLLASATWTACGDGECPGGCPSGQTCFHGTCIPADDVWDGGDLVPEAEPEADDREDARDGDRGDEGAADDATGDGPPDVPAEDGAEDDDAGEAPEDGPGDEGPEDAGPEEVSCVPTGEETCDGVDNDCDGVTDPEGTRGCAAYYADADGDRHGDPYGYHCLCYARVMPGYIYGFDADLDDCDDTRASVHPGATESCNGIDDDCDGFLDPEEDADADGWGSAACGGTDCDDADPRRNPGMAEAAALAATFEDVPLSLYSPTVRQVLGTPDGRVHLLVSSSGLLDVVRDPATGAWTSVRISSEATGTPSAAVAPGGSLAILFAGSEDRLFWSDGAAAVDTGLTMVGWLRETSLGITDAANAWAGDQGDEYSHDLYVIRRQSPGRWTRELLGEGSDFLGIAPYAVLRLPDGNPGLLFSSGIATGGDPYHVRLARPGPGGWPTEEIVALAGFVRFAAGGVDADGGLVVMVDDDDRPLRVYRKPRGAAEWTTAHVESGSAMLDDGWSAYDIKGVMGPAGRLLYARWDVAWESIRLRLIEPVSGAVLATHWQVDTLRSAPENGAVPGFLPDGRLALAYRRGGTSGLRVAFLARSAGDGVDSDCDGADGLDGDGDGRAPWVAGGDDCDDGAAAIRPGAADRSVDGIDQDCDGMDGIDADGDLSASHASGGDDCDDADPLRLPTAFDGADLAIDREDLAAPPCCTWTAVDRRDGRIAAVGTADGAIALADRAEDGSWTADLVATPTTGVAAPSYDPVPAGGFERHLSYYDPGADDLYYAGYAGGTWTFEQADTLDDVGATSQVVAVADGPQVLYQDRTSRALRLARRTATGWTTERLDADGPDWIHLARGPDGTPYVLMNRATWDTWSFHHPDGSSWHEHAVSAGGTRNGTPALAFLLGVPYVGFTTSGTTGGTPNRVHRQRFEADAFVDESVDQSEAYGDGVYLMAADAAGRFWYLSPRGLRVWDDAGCSAPIDTGRAGSNAGRMIALPDGSVEAVYVVSGRVERLRAHRPGDGIDNDCDGVDGVDADRDGHAWYDTGGDDCDDGAPAVHPGAPDPAGDGLDADCDGLDD